MEGPGRGRETASPLVWDWRCALTRRARRLPRAVRVDCAVNRPETMPVPASRCPKRQRGMPRMSIFNHPHAIAASKCANCRHLEVIIADLQAWVDDLRQSRDRWRELALDAKRIADFAEHAAAEAA
jgi:hypothetical protein